MNPSASLGCRAACLVVLALFASAAQVVAQPLRAADLAPAPADLAITVDDGVTRAIPSREVVYVLSVRNHGPSPVAGAWVKDRVPTALEVVSWQCSAGPGAACAASPPAPAAEGAGDVNHPVYLPPLGEVVFRVRGILSLHAEGTLVNSASVTPPPGVPDPDLGDNVASDVDQVFRPFRVTKEVSGSFLPGDEILYVVTLTNETDVPQPDNPEPELVDVLPPELLPVAATASSGEATLDPATRTVTWNGSIPGEGVVTLTIEARIRRDAGGLEVVNQGTLHFALAVDPSTDTLGYGATNDGLAFTQDPVLGGPTVFQVLGGILGVPALDTVGLLVLALLLGAIATGALGRG